jgi:hypothetical protein
MRIEGCLEGVRRDNSDFVRLYVLVLYFLVVGILAIYAFSPAGGEMGYILARLIPHFGIRRRGLRIS